MMMGLELILLVAIVMEVCLAPVAAEPLIGADASSNSLSFLIGGINRLYGNNGFEGDYPRLEVFPLLAPGYSTTNFNHYRIVKQ
jgi:hypothetical protein